MLLAVAEKLGKSNPKLKALRTWVRSASARREAGVVVLETPKLVEDALENGWALRALYTSRAEMELPGVDVFEVAESVLSSIVEAKSCQGVLAVAARPSAVSLDAMTAGDVLVACGVQDPGNVGALVRVAAGAGMGGVIVDAQCADPFGSRAVRGSAGAATTVPIRETSTLAADLEALREGGCTLAAAFARGGENVYDADLTGRTAFIVGGEGRGLDEGIALLANKKLSLPMEGQLESLNVAVAAALLVYEAVRQRRKTD